MAIHYGNSSLCYRGSLSVLRDSTLIRCNINKTKTLYLVVKIDNMEQQTTRPLTHLMQLYKAPEKCKEFILNALYII